QSLNLVREGIDVSRIHVVGNTIADAVQMALQGADRSGALTRFQVEPRRYLLLTLHRQENVDDPRVLEDVLAGAGAAAAAAGLRVLFPAHPRTVQRIESAGIAVPPAFMMVRPCGYRDVLLLQQDAALV